VELGHCEREVPLRDAERPLDLLVWSVVDMAFRTGADRVADLRALGEIALLDQPVRLEVQHLALVV
jgi:hypothetical protein